MNFRNAKTIVEEEAEARGDVIIFCPKFHPELSPIESAYREVAKKLRETNLVGVSRGQHESSSHWLLPE